MWYQEFVHSRRWPLKRTDGKRINVNGQPRL
jgi:hypothetical protein